MCSHPTVKHHTTQSRSHGVWGKLPPPKFVICPSQQSNKHHFNRCDCTICIKKADRTVYDLRYSCRTEPPKIQGPWDRGYSRRRNFGGSAFRCVLWLNDTSRSNIAKRYFLYQKSLKTWIVSALLQTRRYRQTDTDRQTKASYQEPIILQLIKQELYSLF